MYPTYEQTLYDLARQDERVVVMTAENRAAIRNLPNLLGDRFIDVGIAEQTMIGAAAGLALRGRIVVTHALATFLTMRAFEFIRTDVGIANLPVIMVGGVPGFLSDGNGPTHQAIEDVALMRGIPNVGVFCPSDAEDLVIGLPHIVRSGRPFYIRYTNGPAPVEHRTPFALGSAEIVSGPAVGPRDVTILTYGFLLRQVMEAAHLLSTDGLTVQVVNMRTLKPIDTALLLDAAKESTLVVTVEDHFRTGGLHTILAETLLAHQRMCKVQSIALDERWFRPGRLTEVLHHEGFTGERIAHRIRTALTTTIEVHNVDRNGL